MNHLGLLYEHFTVRDRIRRFLDDNQMWQSRRYVQVNFGPTIHRGPSHIVFGKYPYLSLDEKFSGKRPDEDPLLRGFSCAHGNLLVTQKRTPNLSEYIQFGWSKCLHYLIIGISICLESPFHHIHSRFRRRGVPLPSPISKERVKIPRDWPDPKYDLTRNRKRWEATNESTGHPTSESWPETETESLLFRHLCTNNPRRDPSHSEFSKGTTIQRLQWRKLEFITDQTIHVEKTTDQCIKQINKHRKYFIGYLHKRSISTPHPVFCLQWQTLWNSINFCP